MKKVLTVTMDGMMNKFCALMLSVALCAGMAAPAFAYGGEPVEEAEQPVLTSTTDEEDVVTVTDEETGALTPEGNLTLVDDYHTNYSDGSGQQFITLVSKSGATFYLVIDRNAKGQQTVHFINLVDEADLLTLMEEDAADAYTAEKEAAAQAEQDKLKAEEEAKKAAEEAAAFASMRELHRRGKTPDPEHYEVTYYADLPAMWQDVPDNEVLEELFQMFNLSRPQDFEGHSLSVSDVIALKRNGEISVHYVDSIGFKELPGFLDKQPERPSVLMNLKEKCDAPECNPTVCRKVRAEHEL